MVLDSSPTGALVGKPLERPTTEYSAGDTFQPVVWVQTAQHECLEGVLFFVREVSSALKVMMYRKKRNLQIAS